MLNKAEFNLLRYIGNFNIVGIPTKSQNRQYGSSIPQIQAFLLTNAEFIWFIESWEIGEDTGNGRLKNKKLYPAKITGLSIPSFYTDTLQWQDELTSIFQPGFGQAIPDDQNRPFKNASITQSAPVISNGAFDPNAFFTMGAFGRLLSIASWVDPKLAKEYDKAPKGKKKPESQNKINYDEFPVSYPPYDVYEPDNPYYY